MQNSFHNTEKPPNFTTEETAFSESHKLGFFMWRARFHSR